MKLSGEDSLQITAVDFCRHAMKAPDRFWFCPNGGDLSKTQAAKFQKMGLTPGVSDLHLAWAIGSQRQFPCFGTIELKWGKNTETKEQEAFGKDLVALGHTYAVCWTIEEVVATLVKWEIDLHGWGLGPNGIILRADAMKVIRR